MCQRATYFSLQTKKLLCVTYICAVSISQKILALCLFIIKFLQVILSSRGCHFIFNASVFTFLYLKVLFAMPTFKTIHFGLNKGWAKYLRRSLYLVLNAHYQGSKKGNDRIMRGYIGYFSPNITIQTSNTNPGQLLLYLSACLYLIFS